MDRETFDRLYDNLVAEADAVLSIYNPCRACPITACSHDKAKWWDGTPLTKSFCCEGCKHLGPNGCTTTALYCKLWLCNKRKEHTKLIIALLWEIKTKAASLDFLGFRESKEETYQRINNREHQNQDNL